MAWSRLLDRPDSLLKSALEKIVFFECRIDQLTAELSRATDEIERLKGDLARGSERELALKRELADEAAKSTMLARERDEARRKAELFLAERERFLGRLIESEQIRQAGDEADGVDLAAFIAELRGEVLRLTAENGLLRRGFAEGGRDTDATSAATTNAPQANALAEAPVQLALPAIGESTRERVLPTSAAARASDSNGSQSPALNDLAPAFRSTDDLAQALADQGRIGIGESDIETLRQAASFPSRSEETLFALSLKELSAPDTTSRLRAAQRLKSMNPRAALPALASALHAEKDAEVCKVLIEAVAEAGSISVLPLLSAHLSSPNVDLRLCALEAAFRLGADDCLSRALDDDAPLVRRRAVVLASGGADQRDILERAIRDPDASVRRVAALGLGATLSSGAISTALLMALDDRDEGVRRAAARGLSVRLGADVHAVADLDPSRRRREVRRLSAQQAPQLTTATNKDAIARRLASISRTLRAVETVKARDISPSHASPTPPVPPPAAAAPVNSPEHPPKPSDELAEAIVSRVYGALRGQSDRDLAEALRLPRERIHQTALALATSGRLVRRGDRYFVP